MDAVSMTGRLGRVFPKKTGPLSQLVASRKGTTILVRWLAIIATSYLLLLNQGSGAGLAIEFLIGFYIATNLLLMVFPATWFSGKGFEFLIVLMDTLLISLAIFLAGAQQTDLYLAYFLILMFSAVGHRMKTVVMGAVIISFFYGWTLFNSPTTELFHDPGLLFRIPFLFLLASFYGFFVEENISLKYRVKSSTEKLRKANQELEHMAWSTLRTLLNALDIRDINTAGHSHRVRRFTTILAEKMGLKGEDLRATERGALLHDIGKIGIPDSILQKPSPLSKEEWEVMRKHPIMGYQMLKDAGFLSQTARIVLHHHERFDGKGYPSGMKGKSIPLGARLFAVIDAFDAITTNRPYKKGLAYEDAVEDLRRNAGLQFDPDMVKAFLAIPESVWDDIRTRSKSKKDSDLPLPTDTPSLVLQPNRSY